MWKNGYWIMWTHLILHVSQRILRLPVTYEIAAAFNYVLIWINQPQLQDVVWHGGKGQVGTEALFLFWAKNPSSSAGGPGNYAYLITFPGILWHTKIWKGPLQSEILRLRSVKSMPLSKQQQKYRIWVLVTQSVVLVGDSSQTPEAGSY